MRKLCEQPGDLSRHIHIELHANLMFASLHICQLTFITEALHFITNVHVTPVMPPTMK